MSKVNVVAPAPTKKPLTLNPGTSTGLRVRTGIKAGLGNNPGNQG
jgi:hypothetical protein